MHDIERVDDFNHTMVKLGYQPKGEFGIPGRRFFSKGNETTRTHNAHMFQTENPEVDRHLNFRDYLIAHPEEAQAYNRLKADLAQKFPEDIKGYKGGKDRFIKERERRVESRPRFLVATFL